MIACPRSRLRPVPHPARRAPTRVAPTRIVAASAAVVALAAGCTAGPADPPSGPAPGSSSTHASPYALAARLALEEHTPTLAEARQLARLLGRHAGDPAFASFLGELAPDQLYRLLANLAGMSTADPDGGPPGWRPLLATIQQGLGTALATATRPGPHQVTDAWLAGLAAAGRERVGIAPHVPHLPRPAPTVDVYGYQLLGPLLHHGRYGERFLATVGGDLLEVELEQGGSEVWMAHHPDLWGPHAFGDAPTGYTGPIAGIRLDWVHGWRPGGPHGFDPLVGLASAIERDPVGARALLTGVPTDQVLEYRVGGPGRHLPRLGYLLTDREWPTDLVHVEVDLAGFDSPAIETYADPGPGSLGRALVNAVTEDPDDRSRWIVESTIFSIADDEQRSGYPNDPTGHGRQLGDQTRTFREVDLVAPRLRPHLAEITVPFIGDIHRGLAGSPQFTRDLPGDYTIYPGLPEEVALFLAELGKDPRARDAVVVAETVYAGLVYGHYLRDAGSQDEFELRLQASHVGATTPAGSIFGAVDFGTANEPVDTRVETGRAYHHALQYPYFLAELVTDTVTGSTTRTGDQAPALPPIRTIVDQALPESLRAGPADPSATTRYRARSLRLQRRALLRDQFEEATYRHTARRLLGQLGLLYGDGHPRAGQLVPRSAWDPEQQGAWGSYLIGWERDGFHGLDAARFDVGRQHDAAYTAAQRRLESLTSVTEEE